MYVFDNDGQKRIREFVNFGNNTQLPKQDGLDQPCPDWFWGIIVEEGPDSETNFAVNQYWIKRARVTNSDTDNTTSLSFEILPENDPRYLHTCATNLTEQVRQSHLLENGTVVQVRVLKSPNEKITRHIFSFTPNEVLAYAAGFFDSIGSQYLSSCVISWQCDGWQTYNSSPTPDTLWIATSICLYDSGNGPEIYCGSDGGINIGDPPTAFETVAKWNGEKWVAVSVPTWNGVKALCVFEDEQSSVDIPNSDDSGTAMIVRAIRPGEWGDSLTVKIDNVGSNRYRVTVYLDNVEVEKFSSMTLQDQSDPRYIITTINGLSRFIRVEAVDNESTLLPASYQLENGENGYLYAGGDGGLAKYDGTTWTEIGDGGASIPGASGTVHALRKHDNLLYVGGNFETFDDTTVNSLITWDGSSFSAIAGGVLSWGLGSYGTVQGFEFFDDDGDGEESLHICGNFEQAGTNECKNVAKYNGSDFISLANGIGGTFTNIYCLCWYFDKSDYNIYAGGQGGAYKFVNNRWQTISTPASGTFYRMVRYKDILLIGGNTPGGIVDDHFDFGGSVLKYDSGDDEWEAIGGHVSGLVNAIAVFSNELIIGGGFTSKIASYDSVLDTFTQWGNFTFDGAIRCLKEYQGNLIAGGDFSSHLCNAESGAPLGACDGNVHSIYVDGADMWVCGTFNNVGDATNCGGIAYFNSNNFHTLDNGVAYSNGQFRVNAVIVYDSKLYIGGLFDSAGGTATDNIAVYNSGTQQWEALPCGGVDGEVLSFTIADGNLIIGGTFESVNSGGTSADNVIACDGSAYITLQDIQDSVRVVYEWGGELYAETPDFGSIYNKFQHWNGSSWEDFGSVVAGEIRTATDGDIGNGNELFLGGGIVASGYQNTYGGHIRPCNNILTWNGITIERFHGGIGTGFFPILGVGGGTVRDIFIDWYGEPFFTGNAICCNHTHGESICKLTFRGWEPVGLGIRGGQFTVLDIVRYRNGIVLGGQFLYGVNAPNPELGVATDSDYVVSSNVIMHDNTTYVSMAGGLDQSVNGLCLGTIEGYEVVIASGGFTDGCAYYDNYNDPENPVWVSVNSIQTGSSDVRHCQFFNGNLFVCGQLDLDGGGADYNCVVSDCSGGTPGAWSDASTPDGLAAFSGMRFCIATIDGSNPELFMGGNTNDNKYSCVYKWNGSAWEILSETLGLGTLNDLHYIPSNGENGNKDILYAVGTFNIGGNTYNLITFNNDTLEWDGLITLGGFNQMNACRGVRYQRQLAIGGDLNYINDFYLTYACLYDRTDFVSWFNRGCNWLVLRFA